MLFFMSEKNEASRRRYHAHRTAGVAALHGLPLATFWQRVLDYSIDVILAVVIWAPLEFAWRR
jgi:hypothetical protein